MIQRKQTIWLIIAALLNAGVLLFDLFRVHTVVNGVETIAPYRTNEHFPLLLIAIVMILLPLVTIFLFGNRARQMRLCAMGMVASSSFITLLLSNVSVEPPATVTYWIGSVLPVVSLLFFVLAIIGIRKDEKLVKSVDRLR